MILQALYQHYDTLCKKGKLSRPGWDAGFKVTFGLELSEEGKILDLLEFRHLEMRGKKEVMVPRVMNVPAHAGRSSGISANFLCDNSSYMLGVDEKGKPERSLQCFQANGAMHHKLLDGIDSPAARSILDFFDSWNPAEAICHPSLSKQWEDLMGNTNLIFCYQGKPVTEDQAICGAWDTEYAAVDPDAVIAQCLITGEISPIAATHPPIKGVEKAQSSGAALVSFNASAFCSYGHEQNYNAPVSEHAAFAYTAALNALLSDRNHCKVIGDTTVVCWAEHGEESYQDAAMAALYGEYQGIKDEDLAAFLDKLVRGEPMDWGDIRLDSDEHFYVLGLAPNAARLSVRFFFRDSFGVFLKNISQHYQDIAVVRPSYDRYEHIPLETLLKETVNPSAKDKSASPQMAGDALRAILNGTPYPATLLNGVELRIRAEKEVTRGRAGIIKGYYLRQKNIPFPKEVLQMELNPDSSDVPYTLGRLFYVLEWIQEEANPNLNTTIKDKYFSSASSTPSIIFPRLVDLANHHLKVLRRMDQQYHTADRLEKKMETYQVMVGKNYPVRLDLPERGAFQLGYYFERQNRYSGKNTDEKKEG